jgi:hypothetical protein
LYLLLYLIYSIRIFSSQSSPYSLPNLNSVCTDGCIHLAVSAIKQLSQVSVLNENIQIENFKVGLKDTEDKKGRLTTWSYKNYRRTGKTRPGRGNE